MKTKITLTLLGLFLFMNGKKTQASSLTIDLKEDFAVTYFITLNNTTTYQSFDDLIITDLHHGQHKIEIIKQIEGNRGRRRGNIQQEFVVFNGFIEIPPRSKVKAQLRHRNLLITEVIKKPVRRRAPEYAPQRERVLHSDRIRSRRERAPAIMPMSQHQFDNLFYIINNESFDSGKLDILAPVLSSNHFSSAQILDLMSSFSFDSGKLKVAQLGYRNTIDKRNYFTLNNGLTFSSSKRKLNKYIQSQGI
jgi:hypothetical protein